MSRIFTFGERLGLAFIVQSATLSVVAVTGLLAYVAFNALRNSLRPPTIGVPQWHFLRGNVDYYFLSLLVSDVLLAIGSVMNIRWIHDAHLTKGVFCTSQGVVKQLGNVGVALSSLCIAVHTFLVLFIRWTPPPGRTIPIIVVGSIWLFLILITTISPQMHKDPAFYGFSIYWCWIDKAYLAEQIGLQYGILWFTAAANFFLYVPLFLCLRGNIVVDDVYPNGPAGPRRLKITWRSIDTTQAWSERGHDPRHEAAKQMLAYPIVYVILVLPLSIVRWINLMDDNVPVPPVWTAFAGVFFASSGLVNVVLYSVTRPGLFPSLRRFRARLNGEVDEALTRGMRTEAGTVMMGIAQRQQAHQNQVDGRPSKVAPPTLMLADDGDDDDVFASTSIGRGQPSDHARDDIRLTVPSIPDKNSWASNTSGHSIERY